MQDMFHNLINILKKELSILWIFSVTLGLALVALGLKNKLPMGVGDFVFISILALCVALYRPRWIFLLFVSLVPLENVILVSGFLPLQLRPYQYAGVILIIAIIILWISGRLNFKFLKPIWIDWLVFSLVPLSFLSVINSPSESVNLKNNLILISFVVLYWLVRNFVRSRQDIIDSTLFFIGSNTIVLIYGFYQVFADKFGARSFEVMFGRPNSTFTEADWLGIFLCFALAINLALIYTLNFVEVSSRQTKGALYLIIFLNITLLILTLSRSAWIGAATVIFFWLLFSLYKKDEVGTIFTPRVFVNNFIIIFLISLVSLITIHFGKLSRFDIFDRVRSAATSEQKITIACENNLNIPQTVADTDELAKFSCQHINLEEIERYKTEGKFVTEIFRKDPNVLTRGAIYRESWEIIRKNPVVGVGFGSITQILGTDARGTGLNESNIFLQVWAGSGILGLIAFSAMVAYLFMHSFRKLSPFCPLQRWLGCPVPGDSFEKMTSLFTVLGIAALIIPNLFNAGLLMGLFWLGLGVFISLTDQK